MTAPPLRCVFLGYLWKVARALHESPDARLLAVGIEPQRVRSADAIRFVHANRIPFVDARQPPPFNELDRLMASGIDLLVVGGFGRILSAKLLNRPHLGAINVHCSLLPAYRGGCPIEQQILAGETRGGVTLHWMTEDVDAGPILAAEALPISDDDAYADVLERCHEHAEKLLANVLSEDPARWPRTPQAGSTPVLKPRTRDDGIVDWRASAIDIKRLVRADGWRGWVRTCLPEGEFVIESVASADTDHGESGARPGQVLVGGDAPVIQTGQGAIKVLRAVSPRPLVAGERLHSTRATS